MNEILMGKPARDAAEYSPALKDLAQREGPTVIGLRIKIPTQGRADVPLASTDGMTIILKAYAKGGENSDPKAFASKTLPTLQHDLMMAENLSNTSTQGRENR